MSDQFVPKLSLQLKQKSVNHQKPLIGGQYQIELKIFNLLFILVQESSSSIDPLTSLASGSLFIHSQRDFASLSNHNN